MDGSQRIKIIYIVGNIGIFLNETFFLSLFSFNLNIESGVTQVSV